MYSDPEEREDELKDIVKHGRKMEKGDEEDSDDSLDIKGGGNSLKAGVPILEAMKHKKTKEDQGNVFFLLKLN